MKKRAMAFWLVTVLLCGGFGVQAAPAPSVSARSAVLFEPESGRVLWEKDGNTPRPMASTTKLMTALLAAESLEAEKAVTVSAAALPVEGTQIGLRAGETLSVRDLLAALLLASGNDAANALALAVDGSFEAFAGRMNRRAATLGMKDSLFVTPSGLDAPGHAASAADMARLGAAVLKNPLLAELCAAKTATVTVGGRKITLSNHNRLLKLCEDCVGLKTGFTKKSGRCLVSAAKRNGITLVAVTLNAPDDWNDHLALYTYGFSLVERVTLKAEIPVSRPVMGGEAERVRLTAVGPTDASVVQGEKVTAQVELSPFLWAPLEREETVGRVRFFCGERPVAEWRLVTAESVEARPVPGAFGRFWRHMKQLLTGLLS